MGAQNVQEQNDSAQGVAGQVGGSEGPAQLAGFLFPSRNLNSAEERIRQHKMFAGENPGATWKWGWGRSPFQAGRVRRSSCMWISVQPRRDFRTSSPAWVDREVLLEAHPAGH